jgi:hypothetical protein
MKEAMKEYFTETGMSELPMRAPESLVFRKEIALFLDISLVILQD